MMPPLKAPTHAEAGGKKPFRVGITASVDRALGHKKGSQLALTRVIRSHPKAGGHPTIAS